MNENLLFPPLVMRLNIQDVDELIEAACRWNWNSDYRLLRGGTFKSTACLARLGGIQFTYESLSKAIHLQAESPKECLTLGIVDYGWPRSVSLRDRNIWLGQPLSPDAIAITKAFQGIDLVTINSFAAWTASVPIETLQAAAEDYGYLLSTPLLQGKVLLIYPPASAMASLRGYLQNLFAMIQTTPDLATQPTMQSLVRQDFLPLLIEALMMTESYPVSPSPRYRLVKQVEEMVLRNAQKSLTLHDLCKAVKVNPRTLNYAFQDCVGISPMAYLKAQRLNGARRQLKTCAIKGTKVTKVANQWGFWHLGHFLQDYKKMFGESPSTTLKRS